MFKTILVGIDGSDASHRALRVACEMARTFSSELHLVHTPQPQSVAYAMGAVPGYHGVVVMPPADEVEEAKAKVMADAKAIAAEVGATLTSTHAEQGEPAAHIVAQAEAKGADLIVTGRRGLGTLGRLMLGSTSQSVNQNAGCATMTVP